MKLFGQIVRTVVNTAILPVKIVEDTVKIMADAADDEKPFNRTAKQIEKLKDEAMED